MFEKRPPSTKPSGKPSGPAAAVLSTKPRKRKHQFFSSMLSMFSLTLLGVAGLYVYLCLVPGPLKESKSVVIPKGMSTYAVTALLTKEQVIYEPFIMQAAARLLPMRLRLRAGEYAFPPQMKLLDVMALMDHGQMVVRRMTVPEGKTVQEIAAMLRDNPMLTGEIAALPPEGTLLPETYHYTYGDDRNDLIKRMQEQMQAAINELWPQRDQTQPVKTLTEALTLASIIEKETGVMAERARVSGVFANRLKLGMKLQSDPTVIYALSNGAGKLPRALTRKDWEFASPFNTYVNAGLPPQPIANPGRASLHAALHPEAHDYLYFVADGTGGHKFAQNLKEHNVNVARWLAFQRKQASDVR